MKLATVEKISDVITHPNADKLTIYKMDGLAWRVISGEKFNIGDLVVYIQTDTVVPNIDEFNFLANKKYRVNCIRLRGEYSNGLILPMSILPDGEYNVGYDVTDIIGVKKYEKPVSYTSGDAAGPFPTHIISKSDEIRIENHPDLIENFRNKDVYVSVKHDGSSLSIINHEKEGFMVCSRNNMIKESDKSKYWNPVFKYKLKERLPIGYSIQCELIGNKIQKNRENIKGLDIRVFHVWKLEDRKLLDYDEFKDFCDTIGVPTVDLYYRGKFKWNSVDDMIEEAKKVKYSNNAIAEGLVWKLAHNEFSDVLCKELSVKTINYNYKD